MSTSQSTRSQMHRMEKKDLFEAMKREFPKVRIGAFNKACRTGRMYGEAIGVSGRKGRETFNVNEVRRVLGHVRNDCPPTFTDDRGSFMRRNVMMSRAGLGNASVYKRLKGRFITAEGGLQALDPVDVYCWKPIPGRTYFPLEQANAVIGAVLNALPAGWIESQESGLSQGFIAAHSELTARSRSRKYQPTVLMALADGDHPRGRCIKRKLFLIRKNGWRCTRAFDSLWIGDVDLVKNAWQPPKGYLWRPEAMKKYGLSDHAIAFYMRRGKLNPLDRPYPPVKRNAKQNKQAFAESELATLEKRGPRKLFPKAGDAKRIVEIYDDKDKKKRQMTLTEDALLLMNAHGRVNHRGEQFDKFDLINLANNPAGIRMIKLAQGDPRLPIWAHAKKNGLRFWNVDEATAFGEDVPTLFSDDCSTVVYKGTTHNFTQARAAAIAYLKSQPGREAHNSRIGRHLRELRLSNANPFYLRNLFLDGLNRVPHPAFGTLIVSGDAKGRYRLNY